MTNEEHLRLTLLTQREIDKLSEGMGKTLAEVGTSFDENSRPVEVRIIITSVDRRDNVKRSVLKKDDIWEEVFRS